MPDNKNKSTAKHPGISDAIPYNSESTSYNYIGAGTADLRGTGFGKESYDDDKIKSRYILDPQKLENLRGERQGWAKELGNAIVGGVAKVPFSVIGNVASILDIEDYYNKDNEVGNAVTAWAEEVKGNIEEATKIYKSNDNTLGSREWWMNNGKGLIDSATGFVLTGGALGKGVQLLSNLAKGSKVLQQAINITGAASNAVMLNQAESIPIAMNVYKNAYDISLNKYALDVESGKLTEEEAIKKAEEDAADAAAYSININRINIPLNLTSAAAFLRPVSLTRQVAKDYTKKEAIKKIVEEGSQEYLEENINMIAEKEAILKAKLGKDYTYNFKRTIGDILSKEGFEQGIVGFIGGAVQTAGTNLYNNIQKNSVSYDEDGNIRYNEDGTPILVSPKQSQQEKYRAQQKSLKNIESLIQTEKVPTVKQTLDNIKKVSNLVNDIQIASLENKEEDVEILKNELLTTQALDAFKNGTTEQLINLYSSLSSDANSKEKYGEDVMITSKQAIKKIEELESVFNKYSHLPQVDDIIHNIAKTSSYTEVLSNLKAKLNSTKLKQASEIEALGDFGITQEIINDLESTREISNIESKIVDVSKNFVNSVKELKNILSPEYYENKVKKQKKEEAKEEKEFNETVVSNRDIKTEQKKNSPVVDEQLNEDIVSSSDISTDELLNILNKSVPSDVENQVQSSNEDIEPEYQEGDYNKVKQLVKDTISGVDTNTPENLQLLSNYPKLFEKLIGEEKIKPVETIITEQEQEELNDVSASVVDTDRNTTNPVTSETIESNLDSTKSFTTTQPFVTMMSLFKMTKDKLWKRDNKTGEVERDNNSNVTSKVNNSDFAQIGSDVEFKTVSISPEGTEDNLRNIEESRKSISNFRKRNPNGPYTKEDEDFTADYLTESIGIYSEGELIGFVPIPHYVKYSEESEKDGTYDKQLAARKELIEVRKQILAKKDNAKSVITVKGAGKLLTRVDNNGKPILNPIPLRDQDTFDGISLYVYDNGQGIVPFGDIENLFLNDLDKVKQFQSEYQDKSIQKNRIFKVVQSANGSYRVIPVYTSKLNDSAVDKIVDILKNADLSNFESQKKLVKDLQDYVFATSISNEKYKHVINAIKIDNTNGTISLAGNTFKLEDIANNKSIKLLKESLKTLSHNINGEKINTEEYQNMLHENGIIQSNAYLDNKSGEFFVQPYIEFAPFAYQDITNTSKDIEVSTSEPLNETKDDDIDNYQYKQDDDGQVFSTTKFDGNLEKAYKVLSNILPGLSFADVKEIAKVAPHVKDAYGMYRNMLIYLFDGATDKTTYHEAFHGVFRNMLSDNSRIAILKEAESKYTKPTSKDIDDLRSLPGNKGMSNEQLTQLYYEEKLADDFAEFLDFKVNRSLGQKILDFFKNIFKMFNIFNRYSTGQIETLFESVSSGKFAKASKLANRYIDTKKFNTVSYARITQNINLPTQLERTKSIANQFLAKYNAAIAAGTTLTNEEQKKIFEEIRQQYKEVFKNTKVVDKRTEDIKGTAANIYQNFEAFIEEVKKEIAKRNIKLVGNLADITSDIETGENEDGESQEQNENLTQGNEAREFGQEMTSISGIRSATHALKLFLSSIPVIENGKVKKDSYGFDQYHRYETLYYYLEKQLSFEGVISFDQISKILNEASKYRPEYKQVLDAIDNISVAETRESLKRQFASNFSKQVLNYKLVLFSKKNNNYSFKIFDPNRKNVKIDLREKWRGTSKSSNLQDPSNQLMDKYRYYDEKNSMYKFDTEALSQLITEINTKDYSLEEFNILTRSIGIDFDPEALSLIYQKDKVELKRNIVRFINSIVNNSIKDLNESIKALINKNIIAANEVFTSSFNNVENSVVYAIQNQSFASRLAKKLGNAISAKELRKELQKDPIYKYNAILDSAVTDPGKYEMFYYDGLKAEGDNVTGNKFNQIHEEDYEAVAINLFLNKDENENATIKSRTALYSPIIPAEKSLSAIYKAPVYNVNLTEDGKSIKGDSEIVNLFYNAFLNEAGRIKSALEDKRNNVKPIINYHHKPKSKPEAWDGNAYSIHSIPLDKKTSLALVTYLEQNLDDVNALENLSNKNPELFAKIKKNILDNLNKEFQDQLNKFKESGIIVEKDGNLTSKFIKTEQPLNQVVADFTLNSWLFNINNSMLNNGDPAFYKNASDWGKRFYQSLSMTKKIDLSQIDNSFKHIKDRKIKFNVISDYETSTKAGDAIRQLMKDHPDLGDIDKILKDNYEKSNSVNVTDAQVFVSEALYKELKRAIGDVSDSLEIIKPFIYGTQWSDELKRYIPVQIKCAIFPLTNEYVKDNELLKQYKNRMDNEEGYPQAIAFNSAFKAIAPTPGTVNGDDTFIDINLESFGFQVDNRDHSVDSDNSSMRQLKMLMYGIMQNDLTYAKDENGNDLTGEQIKNILVELESANLIEANENLVNMFNKDKKTLNTLISESVTKRNSTSVVESIFAVKPDGEFEYNLDLTGHTQVIQMISSLFSKRAILQGFKGGAYVQASSLGYRGKNLAEQQSQLSAEELKLQSDLQWIKQDPNDPNSIDYIDIAVTAPSEDFYDHINPDGTIKDSLPEELRRMLVYRIPNEGAHSDMVCRIKYILPKGYRNTILMPYEVTKQFGADFDFDKTYFIYKHFIKDKEGKFTIPKYSTSEKSVKDRYKYYINNILKTNKNARKLVSEAKKDAQDANLIAIEQGDEIYNYNFFKDSIPLLVEEGYAKSLEEFSELPISLQNTKEARDNKIIDLYMSLLRNKNMLKSMITPSGAGEIEEFYEERDMKNTVDNGNFWTFRNQTYLKNLFHSISRLKGAAALHVTGHAWSTNGTLKLKNPIRVLMGDRMESYDDLSRVTSDKGNKIVEEVSSMMAAILDAVKTPELLPSLGINDQSLDLWATIVRTGPGTELANAITSQHATKRYTRSKIRNFKKLKGDDFITQSLNDNLEFYKKRYEQIYDRYIKGTDFENSEQGKWYTPEQVNKSSILNYKNLLKFSQKERNLIEYFNENSSIAPVDRLEFFKTQIEVLNMIALQEPAVGELKQMNNLFSINKEVGPNFEDINQKLLIVEAIKNSLEPNILGKDSLINNKLIKSYLDIYESTFNVINEHFMFASKTFNNIKSEIASAQYVNSDALVINSKNRDLINNFVRMFLDSSVAFKDVYEGTNDITEKEFMFELEKILLSTNDPKKEDTYQYKLFGGKTLSNQEKQQLRNTGVLSQIKVASIPNSDKKYLNLKANRLELSEKELFIGSLVSLYKNDKFKNLAENLVKYTFKLNGFYTGLNSFANLIHPEIAVGMGLQDSRNFIKSNIDNLEQALNNLDLFDRIKDQIIRNYPKKFTKVFDNNNFTTFTQNSDGSIALNMGKENSRIKEILIPVKESYQPIQYLRFMDDVKLTKLYRLNQSKSSEGLYVYDPVSMLGYEGLYVEINPFSDLTESELPTNNYKPYTKKVKGKIIYFGKDEFKDQEAVPVTEEGITNTKGTEIKPTSANKYNIDPSELSGINETKGEPLEVDSDMSLGDLMKEFNANTPLVEESKENLESTENIVNFENSFSKEEQDIIIDNFLKKYKIPRNESSIATARKSLNSEIKKDSVKTLELIKKCYL